MEEDEADAGQKKGIELFRRYFLVEVYQDPPCTLKLGYLVPNSGYLGSNRG